MRGERFTLTCAHLIAAGMPAWDVAKFRLQWPDGAEVNPENLRRAADVGLDAHVLFAAVCPTREMLDQWYRRPGDSRHARVEALRTECEARVREVERESDDVDAQHKCDLLVAALIGETR